MENELASYTPHLAGGALGSGGVLWFLFQRLFKKVDAVEKDVAAVKHRPQDSDRVARLETQMKDMEKWRDGHREDDRRDH